jgi:BirA family biotin operon repressor/biotin-[acetyl-CoA-carboxylase] ligase
MDLPKSIAVVPSLRFEAQVTSTNQLLVDQHPLLEDFSVLVAAEQTNGQGRVGRQWVSEPGSSISASILLRPKKLETAHLITLLVAAGIHFSLKDLYQQIHFEIKWPNDILIEGRKLAGILAQLNPDGSVVVGFGINLKPPGSEIEHAAAISEFAEPDFDLLLANCLSTIKMQWQKMQLEGESRELVDYVRENCSTIGLMVRAALVSGESIVGEAIDIADDGRLVIQAEQRHLVSAADVWHLRKS